jgi:hypothetical protein
MTREILGEGEPSAEAAPAYTIRALVRADSVRSFWNAEGLMDEYVGQVIMVRCVGVESYCGPKGSNDGIDWAWGKSDLIIDPTPEQIAEERAKLGLPSPAAQAAPEPSGEGPQSEIEKAFRAGYSAGYDAGSVYGPFSEPMPRLTDDEAWSQYAARSEGPR